MLDKRVREFGCSPNEICCGEILHTMIHKWVFYFGAML
jgi:hypothetical protein